MPSGLRLPVLRLPGLRLPDCASRTASPGLRRRPWTDASGLRPGLRLLDWLEDLRAHGRLTPGLPKSGIDSQLGPCRLLPRRSVRFEPVLERPDLTLQRDHVGIFGDHVAEDGAQRGHIRFDRLKQPGGGCGVAAVEPTLYLGSASLHRDHALAEVRARRLAPCRALRPVSEYPGVSSCAAVRRGLAVAELRAARSALARS